MSWIGFVAFLFAVSDGLFESWVESLPPQSSQSEAGWFSTRMDLAWHELARKSIADLQEKRESLFKALLAEKKRTRISVDLAHLNPSEVLVEGVYEQLPEVFVDQTYGAIFPVPISKPHRFSWYQVGRTARKILLSLKQLELDLQLWKGLSEKQNELSLLTDQWNRIQFEWNSLVPEIRYLESWLPQLKQGRGQHHGSDGGLRQNSQIIQSLFEKNSKIIGALREILRPHRVMRRAFLPERVDQAPGGVLILPIATDVTPRKFLAEIEGALNTHWNQSSWAKSLEISFHIQWTLLPRNLLFKSKNETLFQHLSHFPSDRASITTGGLTTHVKDQTLILGPGKIHPRTLAHELGHLMGFEDCYLRTLTSQGIFGLGVLEWDNPFYPDDIMCDNLIGEPRAEVW